MRHIWYELILFGCRSGVGLVIVWVPWVWETKMQKLGSTSRTSSSGYFQSFCVHYDPLTFQQFAEGLFCKLYYHIPSYHIKGRHSSCPEILTLILRLTLMEFEHNRKSVHPSFRGICHTYFQTSRLHTSIRSS